MKEMIVRMSLGLFALFTTSSCLTVMSASPYGFNYTSIGGDADTISYGGVGGQGLPPKIDSKGREIPAMGSGQLYVTGVNNSESYKTTMRTAGTMYGTHVAGKVLETFFKTGVEEKAVAAGVEKAKIAGEVDKAGIAADVSKAEISAGVAEAEIAAQAVP